MTVAPQHSLTALRWILMVSGLVILVVIWGTVNYTTDVESLLDPKAGWRHEHHTGVTDHLDKIETKLNWLIDQHKGAGNEHGP